MQKSAVITGAGTGVGRAVAIKLAQEGWRLALIGRTPENLEETAQLTQAAKEHLLVVPCSVSDLTEVQTMAKTVREKFGEIALLINSAAASIDFKSGSGTGL